MARLRDYHNYVANCHSYVLPFENRYADESGIQVFGIQLVTVFCNCKIVRVRRALLKLLPMVLDKFF